MSCMQRNQGNASRSDAEWIWHQNQHQSRPPPSDPAPAPSDPAPAPSDPAPSDPAPAPSDPAPSDPDPAPSDPAPAPSDPAPSDPAPAPSDPAPSDPAPAPSDQAPAPSDQAPAPSDQAPAPSDQAPAPSDPAPAPSDQAPAPSDPAPAPSDQAPAPSDQAPAPSDQAPAPSDPAPAPSDQAPAWLSSAPSCTSSRTLLQSVHRSFIAVSLQQGRGPEHVPTGPHSAGSPRASRGRTQVGHQGDQSSAQGSARRCNPPLLCTALLWVREAVVLETTANLAPEPSSEAAIALLRTGGQSGTRTDGISVWVSSASARTPERSVQQVCSPAPESKQSDEGQVSQVRLALEGQVSQVRLPEPDFIHTQTTSMSL
ncbi:unnamed protein product [Boreogadus saida]